MAEITLVHLDGPGRRISRELVANVSAILEEKGHAVSNVYVGKVEKGESEIPLRGNNHDFIIGVGPIGESKYPIERHPYFQITTTNKFHMIGIDVPRVPRTDRPNLEWAEHKGIDKMPFAKSVAEVILKKVSRE